MSPRVAIDLTPRQVLVLNLVSQGLSFAEIAEKLGSKPSSINSTAHTAYGKLGAKTAAHAVRIGFELGILTGSELLLSELARVYRALAVANQALALRPGTGTVAAHPFGEYLLRTAA